MVLDPRVNMKIEIRFKDDVAIVTPSGLLCGGKETDDLERRIRVLAREGNRKLIVDLRKAALAGDQPFGVLLRAHFDYVRRHGRMKLCRVGDRDQRFLAATRLNQLLDVYRTEDEAVTSFARELVL